MDTPHTLEDLQAAWGMIDPSPTDGGIVEMIVSRPHNGERAVLDVAEFDLVTGLVGDNWLARGSRHTEDGGAVPGAQIALMNSRVIDLIAQDRSRWSLAGDQLYVDLDLSADNLQPGQRLAIGTVVLEITDTPHNGCAKFTERFGHDAIRFVNSPAGRVARFRGMYARVIQPGTITMGDQITKLPSI